MLTKEINEKPRIIVIFHIFISLVLYLVLCLFLYRIQSYFLHFLMSVLFFCVSASYLYVNVLKDYFPRGGFFKYLLITLIPVIVGVLHYLLFINPDYFRNVDKLFNHREYQYCIQMMEYTADKWRQTGLFSKLDAWYVSEVKSGRLYSYMGLQFFFAGKKFLGICTFNTLHTLFSTTCILTLADMSGVKGYKSYQRIFIYVMLMPLVVISSYSYRDIVGVSLVSIGIFIMVCSSETMIWNLIALPFACFLCMLFRTQYVIVPLFLFTYYFSKRCKKTMFIVLAYSLWAILAGAVLVFLRVADKDLTGYLNVSLGSIILGPILALIGEFPWTNIFYTTLWQYLPFHYLQAVVNIVIWWTVLSRIFLQKIKPERLDYILVSVVFFSMAAFNYSRHISYASVGTIFLLPFVFDPRKTPVKSKYSIGMKILILIPVIFLLSFIYTMMGFRGSGLASSISS